MQIVYLCLTALLLPSLVAGSLCAICNAKRLQEASWRAENNATPGLHQGYNQTQISHLKIVEGICKLKISEIMDLGLADMGNVCTSRNHTQEAVKHSSY